MTIFLSLIWCLYMVAMFHPTALFPTCTLTHNSRADVETKQEVDV